MIKRVTGVLVALCLMLTAVPLGMSAVYADSGSESVFVTQEGSGKCTLASAVMLVRQKAILCGADDWTSITQSSMKPYAWLEGAGLLHSFSYRGISVSYRDLTGGDNWNELIRLLDKYPEGIVIYERSVPHAVLLTRYDEGTQTFYCADPALSTVEMPLEESWLRTLKVNATEEEIVDAIDCYWYVSSCSYEPGSGSGIISGSGSEDDIITAPPSGQTDTDTETVRLDPVRSYTSGQFQDVTGSEWYFDYAKSAYELGLMNGDDAGNFNASGSMTIAETITIAARIHSLYSGDGYDFSRTDGQWYQPYVDYAYEQGIIGEKYKSANMNAQAARLEFAEILSGALPDEALAEINQISDGTISDVSSVSDAGQAVYRLYRAGVLTGSDDGRFHPSDSISRAEAAAVITRMADSTLRAEL